MEDEAYLESVELSFDNTHLVDFFKVVIIRTTSSFGNNELPKRSPISLVTQLLRPRRSKSSLETLLDLSWSCLET